jgi:RHS repeat-associated protein
LTGLATATNGTTTQNLTFTYDRNGDRLSVNDSVSGNSLSYTYDQESRLTSAISSTTTVASYSYDGDGLRQSKTVGSTTTTFTWDQSGSLPLLLQAGSTSYIDGPDGHPIEQITGSTPSYYLYDALGSVRGVLSATGGYTGYSYDAYGTIPSGNRPTGDYFGFAGEYTDAETGFEYLQARYYDPNTGEFISVDPLKDLTDQPYAYAGDNPLSATDPTGLTSCGWLQWACDAQTAIVDFLTNPGSPETTAALNKANDELDLGTSLDKLHDYIRNSPPGKDTYIALLFASGIFDGLTFNQYSHLAQAFGVTVVSCSGAYKAGQVASVGVNVILAVVTGGADAEADASVEVGIGRILLRETGGAAPGPANFMEASDQFFLNASRRQDIDPNGWFDVIAHGTPDIIEIQTANGPMEVDSRIAARLIEQSPGYHAGQNIRLLSCSTGACATGFAQNLANKLGVKVIAPTDLLWAYSNGRLVVAAGKYVVLPNGVTAFVPDLSRLGVFRIFLPGKP